MVEGRIETQVVKAAQELAEFSQYTTSNMDPDLDYNAHEAYEIQGKKVKRTRKKKRKSREQEQTK